MIFDIILVCFLSLLAGFSFGAALTLKIFVKTGKVSEMKKEYVSVSGWAQGDGGSDTL